MRTVSNLTIARTHVPLPRLKPHSIQAKNGLRYEKNVTKALKATYANLTVLHNPAFYFEDDNGPGFAEPDIILLDKALNIIIECKLTYRPEAIVKLTQLYIPIASQALGRELKPLIVCKHTTSNAPPPAFTISKALELTEPLLQWLGTGKILM